jgi:hypothetical protein
MDQDQRLGNPQLFAAWAGEEMQAWEQLAGVSVTHTSRGRGTVAHVSQDMGYITIHVRYNGAVREHPLWEFRTEIMNMTLPAGLTRADLLPAARARRVLETEAKRSAQEARMAIARQKRSGG